MLSAMFSGDIPVKTDNDGYVFIDRYINFYKLVIFKLYKRW